ncbi:hypothetical protein T492DRAFT_1140530 [Pavlovales sp. CCMP2436]|nr:hypothetical protein T492DRAFT_1140530 [Pavlovales sp. CCMP2436]
MAADDPMLGLRVLSQWLGGRGVPPTAENRALYRLDLAEEALSWGIEVDESKYYLNRHVEYLRDANTAESRSMYAYRLWGEVTRVIIAIRRRLVYKALAYRYAKYLENGRLSRISEILATTGVHGTPPPAPPRRQSSSDSFLSVSRVEPGAWDRLQVSAMRIVRQDMARRVQILGLRNILRNISFARVGSILDSNEGRLYPPTASRAEREAYQTGITNILNMEWGHSPEDTLLVIRRLWGPFVYIRPSHEDDGPEGAEAIIVEAIEAIRALYGTVAMMSHVRTCDPMLPALLCQNWPWLRMRDLPQGPAKGAPVELPEDLAHELLWQHRHRGTGYGVHCVHLAAWTSSDFKGLELEKNLLVMALAFVVVIIVGGVAITLVLHGLIYLCVLACCRECLDSPAPAPKGRMRRPAHDMRAILLQLVSAAEVEAALDAEVDQKPDEDAARNDGEDDPQAEEQGRVGRAVEDGGRLIERPLVVLLGVASGCRLLVALRVEGLFAAQVGREVGHVALGPHLPAVEGRMRRHLHVLNLGEDPAHGPAMIYKL